MLISGPKRTTEQAAKAAYEKLKLSSSVLTDGDTSQCWAVLNAYLKWIRVRVDPPPVTDSTFKIAKRYVESFAEVNAQVPVANLTQAHINRWLATMSSPDRKNPVTKRDLAWNDGGRRIALNTVKAAFRWAVESKLCSTNPFQGYKSRHVNYAGKKLAMTDDEYRTMLEYAVAKPHRDFAHLLMFLYETGARPAEIHQARADEWDPDKKAFVIRADKSNQGRYKLARLGKTRTVYVPDHLVPLVDALRVKYPEGPLFRTDAGTPFNVRTLSRRFSDATKAINAQSGREAVRVGLTSYSLRHAFVSRWVQTMGADIKVLVVLINTSIGVIERTYSHLFERHDALRAALDHFNRGDRYGST